MRGFCGQTKSPCGLFVGLLQLLVGVVHLVVTRHHHPDVECEAQDDVDGDLDVLAHCVLLAAMYVL